MRERTVKRYYCDHCKKANLSRFHMAKHEDGCTKNPERICQFHKFAADGEPQPPMAELLAAIEQGGLVSLRTAAHNCPACILAAIVQFPWPPYPEPEYDRDGNWTNAVNADFVRHPFWDECSAFEFKKERDAFWAEERHKQEAMREAYYGGGYYA